MHINFRLASSRRLLVISGGKFFLAHHGPMCGRPAYKGEAGQIYTGWSPYWEISRELAHRFLARPECQEQLKRMAAWVAWEDAVEEVGIGPAASAVFTAVLG